MLNYHILSLILNKASFNSRISSFLSNYLIDRKTQYVWNNFVFLFFRIDVGIGQESALSPILSTLYITLIFHIFENRSKNLLPNIFISLLSFIDNKQSYFLEKKAMKNQTYIFFVVIILFLLFSINSDLQLNMENQRFYIFLDLQKTSISLLWILIY